jgi:hypothetical protein
LLSDGIPCRFDLFHGHLFIANDCADDKFRQQTSKQHSAAAAAAAQQRNSSGNLSTNQSIILSSSQHNQSKGIMQPHLQQHHSQLTSSSSSCRIGVLFHASEYPAFNESSFPFMLGHCQAGSSCRYNPRAMDLRNILWWQVRWAAVLLCYA